MPQFAANLSMLYPELPFLERFGAAARDGFKGVECLFPYGEAVADVQARLRVHDLQLVLLNAPPGPNGAVGATTDWRDGWRGLAGVVDGEQAFRAGFEQALRHAEALDCPRVHVMAGLLPGDADDKQTTTAWRVYTSRLRWAAEAAERAGRTVLIEPINRRDMPRYLLTRQDEAHALVQDIQSAHLKVQMDLYHCQVTEGDLTTKIRHYLPTGQIGHFQIAGVPDRHEPDDGELDCMHLFATLDEVAAACGWQGWVGCEYRPRLGTEPGGTRRGLRWRDAWHMRQQVNK